MKKSIKSTLKIIIITILALFIFVLIVIGMAYFVSYAVGDESPEDNNISIHYGVKNSLNDTVFIKCHQVLEYYDSQYVSLHSKINTFSKEILINKQNFYFIEPQGIFYLNDTLIDLDKPNYNLANDLLTNKIITFEVLHNNQLHKLNFDFSKKSISYIDTVNNQLVIMRSIDKIDLNK